MDGQYPGLESVDLDFFGPKSGLKCRWLLQGFHANLQERRAFFKHELCFRMGGGGVGFFIRNSLDLFT